jgi:hypothetical protein
MRAPERGPHLTYSRHRDFLFLQFRHAICVRFVAEPSLSTLGAPAVVGDVGALELILVEGASDRRGVWRQPRPTQRSCLHRPEEAHEEHIRPYCIVYERRDGLN